MKRNEPNDTESPIIREEFVAVDWGTTHLRLHLLDGSSGEVLGELNSRDGISSVQRGDHERVFCTSLEKFLSSLGRWESWCASGGEIYFAGMVTSTLGWFPTPYIPVPAGPGDLLAARRMEPVEGLRLHFFPGLRTGGDVLRGEEVEAFGILCALGDRGLLPGREALLILPGTHSKWIRWEEKRITDFITVLTGDLHAGLHRATLLSRTLPDEPGPLEDLLPEFERGVDLALRDGPLASLFKARSLPVLEGMEPPSASALLSGILIGGEILERTRAGPLPPILVAGTGRLRELYLRAFKRLKIPAQEVPPDLAGRASAEGLLRLRALAREV